jgi:hypothetical protein
MDDEKQKLLNQLRIDADNRNAKPMQFPNGYCTDPYGTIIPPAGVHEHYCFGYDVGFLEAWEIMNKAIKK